MLGRTAEQRARLVLGNRRSLGTRMNAPDMQQPRTERARSVARKLKPPSARKGAQAGTGHHAIGALPFGYIGARPRACERAQSLASANTSRRALVAAPARHRSADACPTKQRPQNEPSFAVAGGRRDLWTEAQDQTDMTRSKIITSQWTGLRKQRQ